VEPRLSEVPPGHIGALITLGLFAHRDGIYDPSGSAVLFARSWAITARHVVKGYRESLDSVIELDGRAGHIVHAVQLTRDGGRIAYRATHAIVPPLASDLALLRLAKNQPVDAEEEPWPVLTLDIVPPVEGELVRSFVRIPWTTSPI
jgi:hypothetical protein